MINPEFEQKLLEFFGASQKTLFELLIGAKPKSVTQVQYNIMEYLYFSKHSSISDLANCMYLSVPNTSREVKKLVEKDFLQRIYDKEDKRKHSILLTNSGVKLMDKAFEIVLQNASNKYKSITESDQEKLTKQLDEVIAKLLS